MAGLKRRKTSSPSDHEKLAKKKPGGSRDIKSLYIQCVENREWDSVQKCIDDGSLEEIIWPVVKQHPTDEKACTLLALLVTEKGGRGVLDFCQDVGVIKKVLDTLLWRDCSKLLPAYMIHFCEAVLESPVRESLLPFVTGPQLLYFIPTRRQELELQKSAELRKDFASCPYKPKRLWVVSWIRTLLDLLEGGTQYGDLLSDQEKRTSSFESGALDYLHRSLELLIDLLSTLSVRQYLLIYLDAVHFVVRCKRATQAKCRLVMQLLDRIYRLVAFPVSGVVGQTLSKSEMISAYHLRATIVQKISHRHFLDVVPDIVFAGVGLICNGEYVRRAAGGMSDEDLLDLLYRLRLVEEDEPSRLDREFLLAVLTHHLTIPSFPLDELKGYPLYPTEKLLWDHNFIPSGKMMRKTPVLALPKLYSQFLSYLDYLLRNFQLVRLESAYEIRSDLVDVIQRVRPVVRQATVAAYEDDNEMVLRTEFTGWARMALELEEPTRIMRVARPRLGEQVPAEVVAEVTIDLVHCSDFIRQEWEALSEFDNLFLIAIDATKMSGGPAPLLSELREYNGIEGSLKSTDDHPIPEEEDCSFPDRYGVVAVRGCMVIHVRDEDGNILSGQTEPGKDRQKDEMGTKRILRIALDAAQYARDMKSKHGADIYKQFNLIVRREGRENNFRAVLETIRGLMEGSGSINRVIPEWLQPILLGYMEGNEAAVHSNETLAGQTAEVGTPLDFFDTFLSQSHLEASFPGQKFARVSGSDLIERRNYRIAFRKDSVGGGETLEAQAYDFSGGVSGNQIRFTPVQVQAIRSGLSPGLTMIVGPPGTGKTDVAVQIISSLYHSFPSQRTVVIAHSNAALNDLFEKVAARGDIHERYLLRLGAGERDLRTISEHDFTQSGRVAHSLARRAELLEKVQVLSESLGVSSITERGTDGAPSYTCETAMYFDEHYVQKAMNNFLSQAKSDGSTDVSTFFPFKKFFMKHRGKLDSLTLPQARELYGELNVIFAELAEYRPLELLRSQRQRTDYFLMKQAKVVAMTCTHAAIARSRLVQLGFHYDNLVVEEAAQMMEIETFIPMLLQQGDTDESSACRLKRICLIGDHHQLPPVIKNMSFAKYSNLDQSMFARLIRLGVPYIQLNRQGRARSDIASLYSWRYEDLGDLDHVCTSESFKLANPGFAFTYQMINIEDYEGKGETSPTAFFYQNLGEAEYAVAMFQYMVLIGYPSEKISILTTYNGQKNLLQDVLAQRCAEGTPFANIRPKAVSTVDKYQGQQNEYIILSLVRTSSVGHLRDIRRLVVAVSRARLGLYVLCRQNLFKSCHTLRPTLDRLSERPTKLRLVLNEHYPSVERRAGETVPKSKTFEVDDVGHLGSIVQELQEKWLAVS